MNSPNQHIPVNNIDPGKNVGDGEGSVQVHLEEDLIITTRKNDSKFSQQIQSLKNVLNRSKTINKNEKMNTIEHGLAEEGPILTEESSLR